MKTNFAAEVKRPAIAGFLSQLAPGEVPTDRAELEGLAVTMVRSELASRALNAGNVARRGEVQNLLKRGKGNQVALRSELAELDRVIGRFNAALRFLDAMRGAVSGAQPLMERGANGKSVPL